MKNFILLVVMINIGVYPLVAQCEICGVYEGKSKHRWQKLEIQKDSTFEYNYRDSWATLMTGTTTGRWRIIDNEIELNSLYNIDEYEVTAENSDLCIDAPKYYEEGCENLVKVQVVNLLDEYIWFFKSVMINRDTSSISLIIYESDKGDFEDGAMSCYIEAETISQINIFNGFYDEFVITIDKESINYVKIKGNFSDELWYTYMVMERWKIKENKLIGNKEFGKFIKIN